ncbi:MAG: HD domain-containing protein [Candidatus Omnitrophica bacterium]|nr:HD domain-containing protein [Candidatus Omnitrophota bacterium]
MNSRVFNPIDLEIIGLVYRFSKKRKRKLYLVGGFLRDILLRRSRDNPDLDFCLKTNAISFGRVLAKDTGSNFVVLDKEHGACRLIKKIDNRTYTLDFTDFRGADLEEDLRHRDFTFNTIALSLEEFFTLHREKRGKLTFNDLDKLLIDPYEGRKDLNLKLIKVADKSAFVEDPLRILRSFSFSCLLGFKIDRETLKLAKLHKKKLSTVSWERIREELFKILTVPKSFDCMIQMDEGKILKVIFPEIEKMRGLWQGPYHHLDVWKHSLETLKNLETISEDFKDNQEIRGYLKEFIAGEHSRLALLKLGALFHDIGKPGALRREKGKLIFHGHERIGAAITQNIARRLKLSNIETNTLKTMIFWHLRPGYLADNEVLTTRAIFRFFRDTNTEALSVLLLSLADQRATRGRLTTPDSRLRHERLVSKLIKEYFRRKKEKKMPRLINGHDLIKEFKLEPSPVIGKILSEVEEMQAIGKIKTKKEALQAAVKFLKIKAQ